MASPPLSPSPAAAAAAAAAASDGGRSPPLAPPSATPPSRRGLPPPCWTNDETLALIESYRDKWHAVRRGNLRAADWEEVATDVARRCARLPAATPKTSVQCRHKIEKLRKRFRSERMRSLTVRPHVPPSSSWPFFPLMESLEYPPRARSDSGSDSDYAGDVRSHHRVMSNGRGGAEGLGFSIPKAVRSRIAHASPALAVTAGVRAVKVKAEYSMNGVKPKMEEMRRRLERKRKEEREREADAVGEMVSALRMVGEGFMRMERMKMDMVREMERMKMEMELKRAQMILDSQRRIVDAFVKGLVGREKKKAKVSPPQN
ncbi:hypothetical protein AXF42_Ash010037 [Apostasia shenzhenica]|uniref:Myb/SANT-like DNA-binding domain-containing protein n=1 Tax=Apostasia shenzhenica TaxID=1088818 RepID=A0A2I0ACM9_9ASPA|nr:hypothetical protein AXF42_Ash010037 [Apostasia shenzhenica]